MTEHSEPIVAETTTTAASEAVSAETSTAIIDAAESTTAAAAVVPSAPADDTADDTNAAVQGTDNEGASTEPTETETLDDDGRVVKLLAVGQEVTGVVKRITEFGAFVDIGVGRDGLVHISELSSRRVGKVGDVLQESQEIQVWIKKLDRDRNRISLTMVDPNTKTIRDLEKGELVHGTVTRILPYGAFVDIGIGRDALLHIREMSEGYVAKPEDVVKVGDELEARVIELSRRRQRVDLSLKGLRPEPEPQPVPQQEYAAQAAAEPEEELVDDFADVEVLTPMELAFKRAMEAEGITIDTGKGGGKKRGKKGRRVTRSIQDEIIARTLQVAGKS